MKLDEYLDHDRRKALRADIAYGVAWGIGKFLIWFALLCIAVSLVLGLALVVWRMS